LTGKVPFPAWAVTQSAPWETVRGPHLAVPQKAELGDLATQMYPWRTFLRESLRAGDLPLWNPYALMGAPFLAEPQTGVFSPLNLFYLLLPTPAAWALGFLLRTFLAALLTALLLRSLGASVAGATAAGIIFAFSGFMIAFQGWPNVDTALWLPLACLAVVRLQKNPGPASISLTGAAFALPVLAGQLETAAHVTLVGAFFFACRFLWPSREPSPAGPPAARARFLAGFAAAGFLALALAAVQLLPTIEWIGQLERSLDMRWGGRPPAEILTFVSHDLDRNPNSANVPIPEGAGYAGMLTLLLAPLALLHRNRRDAAIFALLVAACLQVVYGWGPLFHLSERLPFLRAIPNWRLLLAVDFGLAVLAGLGLSALEERIESRRAKQASGRQPAWWLLPAAAAAVCAAGVGFLLSRARFEEVPGDWPGRVAAALRSPSASVALLAAAGGLLALAIGGRLRRASFAACSVGLLAADLLTASYGHVPFVPAREIFPEAPTFRFLQGRQSLEAGRVADVDSTYGSNFQMVYGLASPMGYDIPLKRTARVLSIVGSEGPAPHLDSGKVVTLPGRLLDLMNLRYLVTTTWNASAARLATRPDRFSLAFSDGSVRVFENRSVLPPAFLVRESGVESLAGEDAEFARLVDPAFDPEKTVILPASSLAPTEPAGFAAVRGRAPVSSAVRGYVREINEVRLRADVSEPSILVVSQTSYPGWRAFVDEKESEVLRADYAFAGVRLGPGSHDVRLLFRPRSLRAGAMLSFAGALVVLSLWARRAKRNPALTV
jgi:hypothetical protein